MILIAHKIEKYVRDNKKLLVGKLKEDIVASLSASYDTEFETIVNDSRSEAEWIETELVKQKNR